MVTWNLLWKLFWNKRQYRDQMTFLRSCLIKMQKPQRTTPLNDVLYTWASVSCSAILSRQTFFCEKKRKKLVKYSILNIWAPNFQSIYNNKCTSLDDIQKIIDISWQVLDNVKVNNPTPPFLSRHSKGVVGFHLVILIHTTHVLVVRRHQFRAGNFLNGAIFLLPVDSGRFSAGACCTHCFLVHPSQCYDLTFHSPHGFPPLQCFDDLFVKEEWWELLMPRTKSATT